MKLGLYQFADGTYAAVTEVVNIIASCIAVVNHNEAPGYLHDVLIGQGAFFQGNVQFQPLVELIAADGA